MCTPLQSLNHGGCPDEPVPPCHLLHLLRSYDPQALYSLVLAKVDVRSRSVHATHFGSRFQWYALNIFLPTYTCIAFLLIWLHNYRFQPNRASRPERYLQVERV